MSSTYITRPASWRGRHRRPTRPHRTGLAVVGAIWATLGAVGAVATAGVVR
jgi:hypothetical protein